nr:probable disease resistance protein At4g27220 [Coffea arabica]
MEALGNLAFDRGRKCYHLRDNLRSLEMKLQRLSNRKIDFESKVKVAERSGTKKRKREVENWFEEVAKIENEFVALKTRVEQGNLLKNAFSSGDGVEKMDKFVEQLMVQSDSDHFAELCLEASESRGEPRETIKLFGKRFCKGLETIPAWLDTNEILRIGIWGMGGVGKTTLAEHIHNHLLENTQFKVYWISVSQDFSIKKLQGDIAKRLRFDLSNVDDEGARARRLRDAFEKMEEMVVLILDDVWEDFGLDRVGIPLDALNRRLILTTRSLDVCNRMQCQSNFELKTLDTEEAWGLFEHTLGSETSCDRGLKDIAKSITERCDGLPLGIVTVAGSMRGVRDICEWRNALEDLKACSVGHDEMEKKVFRILEWSFNRLNECQRNCFLYCSLYPEDWKIKRKELIDLFIWAELMPKRILMKVKRY